MAERATLVVLVGGASSRMGQPKHLLTTSNGTLLNHIAARLSSSFAETLIVGKEPIAVPTGARFVTDLSPARTPLVGICTALRALSTPVCLVIGCDMPLVRPSLARAVIRRSAGFDVAVPRIGGYYEPLLAAYRPSCVRVMEDAIASASFQITATYPRLHVHEVPEDEIRALDPELVSFTNLNTPKHLALLAQL